MQNKRIELETWAARQPKASVAYLIFQSLDEASQDFDEQLSSLQNEYDWVHRQQQEK